MSSFFLYHIRWIIYNVIKWNYVYLQIGILPGYPSGGVVMKVLLSNISPKDGYMIIDIFYTVLTGMNYPVSFHDASMIRFTDVDEGLKPTILRYDFHGKKIIISEG